jgi:hypothetical protein
VKYELVAVGEVISDSELVRIALKGFTKEREVFVKCVVGREHILYWSRLWDVFTQEDIQEGSQRSGQKTDGDDEDVSLAAKRKKKGNSGRDLSRVRCYCCNQLGTLLLSVLRIRRRGRNMRGLRQLLQQPWRTFLPSLIRNFLWLL